jgi:hypothetical protein
VAPKKRDLILDKTRYFSESSASPIGVDDGQGIRAEIYLMS